MRFLTLFAILALSFQARANCALLDQLIGIWTPISADIRSCDFQWQNCETAALIGLSFEIRKAGDEYQISTCGSDWTDVGGSKMKYRCQTGKFIVSGSDLVAIDVIKNLDQNRPTNEKIGSCSDTSAVFNSDNSNMNKSWWQAAVAYSKISWSMNLQNNQLKISNRNQTDYLEVESVLVRK